MEMERSEFSAGEEDLGAVAFGLGEGARAGQSAWATHFSFPRKTLRVLCGYLEHQRASAVRRTCGGAAPDYHGYLARVEVELLASMDRVAGRTERSYKKLPSVDVEGFCG